jgi:hypothetical protein
VEDNVSLSLDKYLFSKMILQAGSTLIREISVIMRKTYPTNTKVFRDRNSLMTHEE